MNAGCISVLALLLAGAPFAAQAQQQADGIEFFEKKIRPVLADKCYKCHSQKSEKVKADLWLDTREGMLRGGESGPAIVPGDLDKSLLIHAIRIGDDELDMPPKETDRLTNEQIRDFETWVKMGAPSPASTDAAKPADRPRINFAEGRKHWSYRPLKEWLIPAVQDKSWPRTAIDPFILAKLSEKGLKPVGDADRGTLLRRVTFDLTGLPPSPGEIEAFLGDASADAYEKVVDRLLASPHYGERWGRHWLDVARYADTAGCNSDYPIPQMYKYRNWVIDAFNADKPYDQFVREQLAGDLLPWKTEAERHQKIIATGYLAATRRFASSENGTQHLIIDDTIDNLGKAFLGLSINCARCHDHKFDAISNEDYAALYGFFQSTRYPFPGIELNKVPRDLVPLVPAGQVEAVLKPYREQLSKLEADLKRQEMERTLATKVVSDAEEEKKAASSRKAKGPEEPRKADEARKPTPAVEADPEAKRKFEELQARLDQARKTRAFVDGEIRRLEDEKAALLRKAEEDEREKKVAEARKKLDELRASIRTAQKQRDDYAKQIPVIESAFAVWEGKEIGNAKVLLRGDPKNIGPEVPRRFLEVLGGQALPSDAKGSGRLELADWIVDPRNPLAPRVMVNRIWQYHFGRGLVQTPNDFGVRGMAPTHPELLDFLAKRFVESGWSVKAMHRLICLSRTYRLSSSGLPGQAKIDPNNDGLWKFSRRRLEAEAVRDAMLAVSGALDRAPGGPHPFPPQSTWGYTQHRQFMDVYETDRRSVYVMTQRIKKHPFFGIFDGPDTNATTASRVSSTTPLQSLFMMNDPFVHEQARKFSARLTAARPDDAKRIELAYLLAFGRPPASGEREAGLAYLAQVRAKLGGGIAEGPKTAQAWESYARVLLRLNEFITVD